ncbi:hypothetical protein M1293_01765, partial [Candidatus Parvarchaeota archaeon]|nr:hypothetical protein [Candidatus Parvarchaeota archaeon]
PPLSYHAINGLTAGRSEGKPTENSVNMTIKRVEKDAMHGRLADIYLTAHQVSTDFTAIDFQSKETPTYILNQGALWDIDKKDELRSKWIYASDMKAEDEDSGISIFTLYDDYSVDIQHIDFTGLNEKLDINAMEKEADKKLQEMSNLSDLHIGAADTKYNIIEAAIDRLSASKVPKDKRYLFLLGDILHAGNDKASRTKILFPTSNIQEETISKLEKELGNAKTKEELKQKIVSVFEDVLYGASTPDIGRQNRRANYYLRPLIDKFGTMITVPGNHGEKTMNGDESGMFGPNFENGGTKVEYIDDLLLKDEIPNIGGYNMFIIHSPGFRGGYDAGTTLMKTVENEGRDTTDMALAGDCHEPHLKFIAKKKTVQNGKQNAGKWKTLIAVTAPSLERYSRFESEVVKKPRFSRGISRIFLPDDQNIGTSYSRYNFIPEYTLKIYAEANGSKAENVINKYLEALEK